MSLIYKTAELLVEDLQVESGIDAFGIEFFEDSLQSKDDGIELLTEKVQKIVENLLVNDLQGFFNMVYRLDVGEAIVREKLATCELSQASKEIAVLIIEREVRKVESRQKYSFKTEKDDPEAW